MIAFRGSRSLQNWIANIDFGLSSVSFCTNCKAHAGFKESWGEAQAAVEQAVSQAQAQYPSFKLIATGHSLGGSLATLAAASLRSQGKVVDLYTYGAPRTGNDELSAWLGTSSKGASSRSVHQNDTVPTLPPRIPAVLPYGNIFPEYYITSANGVMPTTADVKVISSGDDGNPGSSTDAHSWYFGPISACAGDDGI